MKRLFTALARDIAAEVQRRADPAGNVPRSATFEIQQAAGQLVQRLFLGRNRTGELVPFDTLPNGALIPLSPYMRQLWESIKAVVRIPVEQSAVILTNKLPADVLIVMRSATGNPFVAAKRAVSEQVFRPNPLAVYAAPHEWVDPAGYRLSDRVWNTATETRRQIDAYLETAIREGRGALTMSRELSQFLTPGEQLRTTTKPYGTTASYSAMRLARTEITRAHNQAHRLAAALNPFVAGLKWNLSARHPRYDICDEYARGGPNGDGVYDIDGYPEIPHPNCICFPTNVLANTATSTNLIDELRADIQSARQEFVNLAGPLQVEQFERLLLGQGLEVEGQTFTRVVGVPTAPPVLPPVTPVVIEPPPVVVEPPPAPPPVVVPPPPVVVEPPPPAVATPPIGLAADARRRIVEANRPYETRFAEIDRGLTATDAELRQITRSVDELEISLGGRADTPQGDQIEAKIFAQRAERNRLFDQRRALRAEQARLQDEQKEQLRIILYVDRPAGVTMRPVDLDANQVAGWQEGVNGFNRLVSADVAPARTVFFTDAPSGRTSYNPESKFVRLADGIGNHAVVHELGHWLEDNNPEVHQKALEFYKRRTQGEVTEWMGPGFSREEVTRKDKFIHPYMGMEYLNRSGQRFATEIVSMGIEYFYSQPYKLATEDPDMFDFIFNLLRGR